MWVDTFTIGVRGWAVGLAFDDDALAAELRTSLEPYLIEADVERIDYAIQTATSSPDAPVRAQPALLHGRRVMWRSLSTRRLGNALLIELERVTRAANGAESSGLRLQTAAVIRDGLALLLPAKMLGEMSERALSKRGLRAVDCLEVTLEANGRTIEAGAALGASPENALVVAWWLGESVFGHDLSTPARRLASLLGFVIDAEHHDADQLLRSLADLSGRVPVDVADELPHGAGLVRAIDAVLTQPN